MNAFGKHFLSCLWWWTRASALVGSATVLIGCEQAPQYRLMSAVLAGDLVQVETLLDDPSVDINWKNPKTGDNALASAAAHDRVDIVQLLLRRGADPYVATQEKSTPLQAAAYHGYAQVVKLLIDAGVDVNIAETRYGFTALASAARNGHVEVIRLLLDAGADPAKPIKDGRNAMELALHYGHTEAAQLLASYQSRPAVNGH